MNRYKIRTSKGDVIISFDTDTLKLDTSPTYDKYGNADGITSRIRSEEFVIETGEEHITELYYGWLSYIDRIDGELFAFIELSDGYYGSPEYLLERVEPLVKNLEKLPLISTEQFFRKRTNNIKNSLDKG